jgi:hypothetical protein
MSSLPQEARRSFLELYEHFGDEGHLRSTYNSRHASQPLERDDGPFASQNFTTGGTTTFTGQMVFHSLGLDADLQVVNGIPTSEGPRMVFPNTSMTPKAFRARVKAHFEKKPALPVTCTLRTVKVIPVQSLSYTLRNSSLILSRSSFSLSALK